MHHGLNLPIFGEYADPQLLATLAAEAEAAGWDGVWVWDHVHWSGEDDGEPREPAVDPTIALALIAAATKRIRFGPMVMPLARRRAVKVARELTTLDHLSAGRLTVGVGLGGLPGLEFSDLGEDPDPRLRAELLDESLDVLAGLWTRRPFSHTGRHLKLSDVELLPQPLQQPVPIWVGGSWPEARAPFRRAARFQGVHPLLHSVAPTRRPRAVRDLVSYIAEHREVAERFDVAYGEPTSGAGRAEDEDLIGRFADAGVTWWMEPIDRHRGPLATLRDRINAGP